MNIRSRILKVAKKILSEDFTSIDKFYEYTKNHKTRPGTEFTVNGVPVPNPNQGKNQGGNGEEIQMTDEQKEFHKRIVDGTFTRKDMEKYSDGSADYGEMSDFTGKSIKNLFYDDVASDIDTHPFTLDWLKDISPFQVSKNLSTVDKTLEHLSKNEDENIRFNVSVHPNTSKRTLVRLMHDKNEKIRNTAKERLEGKNIPLLNSDAKEFRKYHYNDDNDDVDDLRIL